MFLKIILFIFTMIITVEDLTSSTVVNLSQETTTYQFQQTESKIVSSVFGNYSEKYCSKEEKGVTCSERGKEREGVVAKTGTNIVGTNYNKVLPTQDWINPAKVAEYKSLLQSGQKLPAINAYTQGGKIFIENGHHRFAAYMELGLEPHMIIRNTGGPIGFPNWLNTTFQIYPY